MNVSATLPLAAASCGSSCSSDPLPAGFTDVLAAQLVTGGEAHAEAGTEGGHGEGDLDTAGVGDVLALAALASRTAHAALPHVTVPAPPVGDASTVEDATLVAPVVPAAETATTEQALVTDGAEPGVVPVDDTGDASVDEALPVPVTEVDAPAGAEVRTAMDPQAGSTDGAVDVPRTATADTATGTATETEAAGAEPVEGVGTEASTDATRAGDGDDAASVAVPTVVSTDESEGSETSGRERRAPEVSAAASDRRRDRAAATAGVRAAGDGVARSERIDALGQTVPAQPTAPGRADPVTPSAAAQRVLDIVTQLEDAPPPRVVVIETGEIRLRVGLDAGVVRLTVLGTVGEGGEEVLREAADALEAGGFGTELDRGHGGGEQREGRDPRDGAARFDLTAPARSSSRPRAGLQL